MGKFKRKTMRTQNLEFASKIGLFGGSFDPIHIGHIEIALEAKKLFNLDEVHFILAKASPFKSSTSDSSERLKILDIALKPYREFNFKSNTIELNREAPSYTYQTLEEFKKLYPSAQLFWIMGSDCFLELKKWRSLNYLIQNLEFLVFKRKITNLNAEDFDLDKLFDLANLSDIKEKMKVSLIENPYIDVSSSEIREHFSNSNNTAEVDRKLVNPTKGLVAENYRNLFVE